MASVKKKDPMPPFTHTLDWWEHPDTGVRFDNPRYETHPDPTGKPTDVVVWTGHCCVDSCHETFRSAHRLPPDGYPKGMPTPQRLSRMTRTRCEYHARLAQNRGEDWGPPETGTVFEGTDGREWILQAYAEVPTLTGGVFTTAVWEGACVVPGCSASLEWRTRAQPLGRPLQGNPPRYCHAHHGGRLGEAPSAQEREWFAEKNAAKKERWVAICAEGRKKAAQARKEKYEKAGPEEKTRMALERAARVKKWSDACIQGRREARARRKEEEAHLPFEEQERIKAEKRAKIKPWLEACAKGRVARSLAYQTAGAEEKARLMADALAKVNAPTVNAPTANAPAPAPTASAPAPAPTANAPAPRQPVRVPTDAELDALMTAPRKPTFEEALAVVEASAKAFCLTAEAQSWAEGAVRDIEKELQKSKPLLQHVYKKLDECYDAEEAAPTDEDLCVCEQRTAKVKQVVLCIKTFRAPLEKMLADKKKERDRVAKLDRESNAAFEASRANRYRGEENDYNP